MSRFILLPLFLWCSLWLPEAGAATIIDVDETTKVIDKVNASDCEWDLLLETTVMTTYQDKILYFGPTNMYYGDYVVVINYAGFPNPCYPTDPLTKIPDYCTAVYEVGTGGSWEVFNYGEQFRTWVLTYVFSFWEHHNECDDCHPMAPTPEPGTLFYIGGIVLIALAWYKVPLIIAERRSQRRRVQNIIDRINKELK